MHTPTPSQNRLVAKTCSNAAAATTTSLYHTPSRSDHKQIGVLAARLARFEKKVVAGATQQPEVFLALEFVTQLASQGGPTFD